MSALIKRYDDHSFVVERRSGINRSSLHRRSTWNTSFSFPPKNSFYHNLVCEYFLLKILKMEILIQEDFFFNISYFL